jgi:hypothetical protein
VSLDWPLLRRCGTGEATTRPREDVGTRVMAESDRLRVRDMVIRPGEHCEKHVHRLPYFFVVVSGGLIRFANPDDPSDYNDVQFADDGVTFVNVPPEGKIDHRLTNIGAKPHRNFLVELLS